MIILTAITKYGIDDIQPFVKSLEMSGYSGRKCAIVYDVNQSTIEYLKDNGWDLYKSELREHIILQRFIDSYSLMKNFDNETVFWTDIKDVIFQKNPEDWVNLNFELHRGTYSIYAFSESIRLKDDPWACVNSGTTFPVEWEWNKDNISYCAGTILGKADMLRDLFLQIYHWSKSTENPSQLSDQAAYNILIRLSFIQPHILLNPQDVGFVVQMGTVWSKRAEFKETLTEQPPIFEDGFIKSDISKEPFYVVHQYDRDPKLKTHFTNKYK
jgi:hypothetical protein